MWNVFWVKYLSGSFGELGIDRRIICMRKLGLGVYVGWICLLLQWSRALAKLVMSIRCYKTRGIYWPSKEFLNDSHLWSKNSPCKRPWRHRGGVEIWLHSFFNLGSRFSGWPTPRPGRFAPGKQTQHPLNRRLVGTQGQSGQVRKI